MRIATFQVFGNRLLHVGDDLNQLAADTGMSLVRAGGSGRRKPPSVQLHPLSRAAQVFRPTSK